MTREKAGTDNMQNHTRELITVELQPVQGTRFQPTGFPDLGTAWFQAPSGPNGNLSEHVLVESAQSMANRLETVCWDEGRQDLTPELDGLPYIRVQSNGAFLTSTILEAHRLNSPYVLDSNSGAIRNELRSALGAKEAGPVDISKLARWCLKNDPNSIVHGLFLAHKDIAGGRYRMKRLLSAFIEAHDTQRVNSGGVKNDRVAPSGDTSKGYGNVPFQREEFTAGRITAYFNLDLATLRGYRLTDAGSRQTALAHELLTTFARWKIRRFLASGLRLRTACDLKVEGITVEEGEPLPELPTLDGQLRTLIADCAGAGLFADPPIRKVEYDMSKLPTPKSAAAQGAD